MNDLQDRRTETENLVQSYGFEPGKMQARWRGFDEVRPPLPSEAKTDWESQCMAALLDALVTMGGVPAWNGDGLGCAMQIVWYFAKRADHAEAELKRMREPIPCDKEGTASLP